MAVEQGNWESLGRCNFSVTPKKNVPNMFPDTDRGRKTAKDFCRSCRVPDACLEAALSYKMQDGVRGGKSEAQRYRILANRDREEKLSKPAI